MRFALVLAGLLFVASSAAAEAIVQTDFASPAQGEGTISMDHGQWVLLLFHDTPAALNFSFDAEAIQFNQTILLEKGASGGRDELPVLLFPPENTRFDSRVRGHLQVPDGRWASVLIVADSITVSVKDVRTNLGHAAAGHYFEDYFPPVSHPPYAVTSHVNTPSSFRVGENGTAIGSGAMTPNEPFPFKLHAQGIRHVAWHNATVFCPSTPCPDSANPWSTEINVPRKMLLQRLSYINVETTGGSLTGDGSALAMAAGGPSIGMSLDGRLRLPDAHLSGSCPRGPCPDAAGQTFLAEGNMSLSGLHPTENGRLQGRLTGQFTSVAFDEAPRAEFLSTGTVLLAAVGLAGLAWLFKLFLGLFARSARPPALLHPRRQALHQLIQAEPGLSTRELQRRLGWGTGTLTFHLSRLIDAGHVVTQRDRNVVRHFENHGRYAKTWRTVAPLRDPDLSRLHGWLLQNPDQDQTRIVAQTAAWGWSRAATRRRLDRLKEAGLVASRELGRRTEYQAKPGPST